LVLALAVATIGLAQAAMVDGQKFVPKMLITS